MELGACHSLTPWKSVLAHRRNSTLEYGMTKIIISRWHELDCELRAERRRYFSKYSFVVCQSGGPATAHLGPITKYGDRSNNNDIDMKRKAAEDAASPQSKRTRTVSPVLEDGV